MVVRVSGVPTLPTGSLVDFDPSDPGGRPLDRIIEVSRYSPNSLTHRDSKCTDGSSCPFRLIDWICRKEMVNWWGKNERCEVGGHGENQGLADQL
jgi:hypothetical protein